MIIGDTPQQLGQIEAADAMLIDGTIVTRDDYRALTARVEALHRALAALSVQAESALQEDIFCHSALKRAQREADEVLAATPQQHLAEIRAQAVDDCRLIVARTNVTYRESPGMGFSSTIEDRTANDFKTDVSKQLSQLCDSIRRGEVA